MLRAFFVYYFSALFDCVYSCISFQRVRTFILMFVYHMMACLQPVCNNLLRVPCIYLSFVIKLFTRLVARMNVPMFDYEINMCFDVSLLCIYMIYAYIYIG